MQLVYDCDVPMSSLVYTATFEATQCFHCKYYLFIYNIIIYLYLYLYIYYTFIIIMPNIYQTAILSIYWK